MGKRDLRVMEEAQQLELHLDRETELFLCGQNRNDDNEWRLYGYETDGTQKVVTYEVTDETPPDRSVVIKNWDSGDEFIISWSVTVTKREKAKTDE